MPPDSARVRKHGTYFALASDMSSVAQREAVEVTDSRRTPRFILDPAIPGTFNGVPVMIYNIAEGGVQFEHKERLSRFVYGDLLFSLPISPRVIRLGGHVAWSRVARKGGELQPWPYRCGLRVENLHALTIDTLAQLLRVKSVRPDRDSLERKRKILLERQREQLMTPGLAPEEVPPPPLTLEECIERVQSARRHLRRNADIARELAASGRREWREGAASDETIAVWQQLRHSVDPALISLVFDLYPE